MRNSNTTVSINSPRLEIQVKKEFNPEKSKIVPQCSPVALQVGLKISHEAACHNRDVAEKNIHN